MQETDNAAHHSDFLIFETTPGLSVLLSARPSEYRVLTASEDFLTFTGLRKADIVGKDIFSLYARYLGPALWADPNLLSMSLDEALTRKDISKVEVRRKGYMDNPKATPGGGSLEGKFIPVKSESGEVLFLVHSLVAPSTAPDRLSIGAIEDAYNFFMNAPVIIGYVRGENYIIEFANEGLLKVWGASKEVVGKPLFSEFPELEQQGTRQLLDQVRQTGKPFFAYEHPLQFKQQGKIKTIYFDFIYQPYYESDSQTVASGIISVGHDVTEQVQIRNKFKNLIEQANDAILILKGVDMTLEVANEAVFKTIGIDKGAIGKPFTEVFDGMEEQGLMNILRQVYDQGEPFQGYERPIILKRRDASTFTSYYNFTCQPYREPNGEVSGVLVVASDATAHVLAKKQAEESQKKWKELANSMPAIVWTALADGSATFFNDRWYEFTGVSEQESLGSGWTKVIHPDDLPRCVTTWDESKNNASSYELEVRYKDKDGNFRWMIARGVPVKDDGKLVAWYGTSSDIDDQKQLEAQLEVKVRERTEELEEKNALLDNIMKHSSNGITVSEMIFDDAGNVVDAMTIMANDAAVKFSGLPRDLYLTRPATELDPGIIASAYGQACIKTLETGEPSVIQYFLEFSSRWLELTVSRMDNRHLIHIFTDVTAIKEAQLQLEKSLEDLRYANTNLEEFAYAASHDLKEPVRKIQFFTNRLKEGLEAKLDARQENFFERLERSAARMLNLIDDLLEYSQAAKGSSVQEDIHLGENLEQVMEDLDLLIKQKQATIHFSELPTIRGNRRQIHQLFQNLVSNALKYSKPGIAPEIRLTHALVAARDIQKDVPLGQPDEMFHRIEVSDNGIGFEQRFADSMFNVFTRLHSDVEYRGSGIGLAIVKKVVESHHGYVWAEGQPGKGSTFTILLPATT